ncbi:DUF3313 domain-containing protein [Pseudomonas sp. BN417]|uniref:DUF3313 domain-containing protein n=1 Tax=Pseudomonas sp. BN417 TaxID=2567890 RepID=UPI0024541258|nr:DUF3313 domain-containing protein [Pseudomonas sp. BN417]MDH4559070.1 DUF3313 domain-containing protein [Pseudomonas sp. BN417]
MFFLQCLENTADEAFEHPLLELSMNLKLLSIIPFTLSLVGCSMAPKIDSSHSEQLDNPRGHTQVEKNEDMIYWKRNDVLFAASYDKKIFLSPTGLVSAADGTSQDLDSAEERKILNRFRSQLQHELLSAGYELVDTPTPRSLALKVSIADIKRTPRDMTVMEYVPIGFLVGLGMHTAGLRDETLYLFFKTEVTDGMNGETFGQAVNRVRSADIDPSDSPVAEDLYPAIDAKARQLRERLDREFQGESALHATSN